MGTQAPRPCKAPGCSGTVRGEARYCNRHADQEIEDRRLYDERRGTSASRGYGSKWQKRRKVFLALNPLCNDPDQRHEGVTVAATVVDHIKPHKGDEALFWDPTNLQALCRRCHDAKTAKGL